MVLIVPAVYFSSPLARAQSQCDTSALDGKSDAELQTLLNLCQQEIDAQKAELAKTQANSATLQTGINDLSGKIAQSQLEISRRAVQIKQLQGAIAAKTSAIGDLADQIGHMHDSLAELLRKTSEYTARSPVEAVLSNEDFSNFFVDVDSFDTVKRELGVKLDQIKVANEQTEQEKSDLADKQSQEQLAKYASEKEKSQNQNLKDEKQRVLAVSKGQEVLYQKDIASKEAAKTAIRNRLLHTVGGLAITFGDALALVQPFENATGIDAALTLAVLTQESGSGGVIGKNLGHCTYNQPWSNTDGTVMANAQKPYFLSITNELGLNAESTPVSCPIGYDGPYGGAMGPAQFIPQTWNAFKSTVAALTGSNPPSPFDNRDAFVGTMSYLAKAEPSCAASFSSTYQIFACTAAKYYAGLTTSGSRLARYMAPSNYGGEVATRAIQFQSDIDKLSL